ncbi:MAG: hypothetical protein KFH98_01640 [Gemmatimonadetes bacterium]|nr:hypothetical protein [Gemmatimonadota bacterium]
MDAWQIYIEEFRPRGERAAAQEVGRDQLLSEAAHEAYRAAADRLTRDHGWEDEHTLVVMRGLNGAVREWISRPGADWDALGAELRRREDELRNGFPDGDGNVMPRGGMTDPA